MFKTLGKFVAALALSCGVMSAQAANFPLSDYEYTFDNASVNKQGASALFDFTIAHNSAAFLSISDLSSNLTFSYAALKTQGVSGWSNVSLTGLSGENITLGEGTYKLKYFFNVTGAGARTFDLALNVSPVPEPESYAMFLAGLGILGAIARRRKQA